MQHSPGVKQRTRKRIAAAINATLSTIASHAWIGIVIGPDQIEADACIADDGPDAALRVTGVRDALTCYTRPLTGAYYFVPSADDLRELAIPERH